MADSYSANNARNTAYNVLRSRIINLELKPHDVLTDRSLMEQLNMSRTPIREAIIMLAQEQLIVIRPQSSTYVAPINLTLVDMDQFIRFVTEKEVITRVCGRCEEKYMELYEENIFLREFFYKKPLGPERNERLLELDNAFHRIAFQMDNKEMLFDRLLSVLHHIERVRFLSLALNMEDHIGQEHKQIVQAIIHNNPQLAEECLKLHMTQYRIHLEKMRKKRPDYFITD